MESETTFLEKYLEFQMVFAACLNISYMQKNLLYIFICGNKHNTYAYKNCGLF